MLLVVGLGNPGKRYEDTRHNVGFMLIDKLSRSYGIRCDAPAPGALWGRGVIAGHDVVLVKPMTFVNLSGTAVGDIRSSLSLSVESIIVAYDDCDLPLGRIRIRKGGGSGGHRGVESIMSSLASSSFPRIRLGIGRPGAGELRDYVLNPFTPEEAGVVDEMLVRAASSIEVIITEGVESAMNRFNA